MRAPASELAAMLASDPEFRAEFERIMEACRRQFGRDMERILVSGRSGDPERGDSEEWTGEAEYLGLHPGKRS